jgi:hypothetical protein
MEKGRKTGSRLIVLIDVSGCFHHRTDLHVALAGMPPKVNEYHAPQAALATRLAEQWHTADPLRTGSVAPSDPMVDVVRGWSPEVTATFLAILCKYAGLSALHKGTTRKMNDLYGLDALRHPEVCVALTVATEHTCNRLVFCKIPLDTVSSVWLRRP